MSSEQTEGDAAAASPEDIEDAGSIVLAAVRCVWACLTDDLFPPVRLVQVGDQSSVIIDVLDRQVSVRGSRPRDLRGWITETASGEKRVDPLALELAETALVTALNVHQALRQAREVIDSAHA